MPIQCGWDEDNENSTANVYFKTERDDDSISGGRPSERVDEWRIPKIVSMSCLLYQ